MYIADLHIHSRYSRATSRDCTPEHLELWARRKGIGLLGTGDFTHPAWREELKEKLVPAEDGLYVLKDEYRILEEGAKEDFRPRFVVSGEISSIYKKNEKVRKVHSVLLLPGLEDAEKLSVKLETIGNIHSDGRPILGLDCHDLLEIMLEICPSGMYIPAHIWTPHFSLFGAFSGFDTIEECFGDLTPQIRALETGLSSDPPMNWRISALDGYQLISNSDAHSPAKLGREANLLDTELSYAGLSRAIQEGEGLEGTIEFFPEEGKYHYDGHRKCHLCLKPAEAEKLGGKCPICGRKLTIGVSHRVEQLADREEGFVKPEAKAFESLVPLPEVIAASTGSSAASKKVEAQYGRLIRKLGSEFEILREVPVEEIRKEAGRMTAEGIRRLRAGEVRRRPGFDGEYGKIELFEQDELENVDGQMSLFAVMGIPESAGENPGEAAITHSTEAAFAEGGPGGAAMARGAETTCAGKKSAPDHSGAAIQAGPKPGVSDILNPMQAQAVRALNRAVAVIAGPGSGKTKTLVSRIQYLIRERGVKPTEITAVTFTRKAAEEMRERLEQNLGGKRALRGLTVGTFHAICFDFLKKKGHTFRLADEGRTLELAEEVTAAHGLAIEPKKFRNLVSRLKTGGQPEMEPEEAAAFQAAADAYIQRMKAESRLDFDDLLLETLHELEAGGTDEKAFSYLHVDEFQDISPLQYRLIQAWSRNGKELFVIGDPDQSIYGFRGSDAKCFERFAADFPELSVIRLEENYRSTPQIVGSAMAVISKNPGEARTLHPFREPGGPVRIVTAKSELSEAIFAAKEINRLVGGIDMLDSQYHSEHGEAAKPRSFSDIALLYRTHYQAELLEKCLAREGIPYVVAGREPFLEAASVQGTLAFFAFLRNPEETALGLQAGKLLWNLSGNELGDLILENKKEKFLPKFAKTRPQKLLKEWMEDCELNADPSMQKLLSMAVFYRTMEEMLDGLTFGEEGDLRRCGGKSYRADAVTLMTLHASKGLEFPVVFLCGVRKGMIPLESTKGETDLEEERRLFFVGMTRAKEELILVTSGEASAFLEEIPEEESRREKTRREEPKERQISLFDFMKE
ncbi:MAG: UvrD-helicase domain-containing protein [Eubacteriales bacterium]|nr:UvrD-helicase domain-containing protein [Eubacteriales bacterium]